MSVNEETVRKIAHLSRIKLEQKDEAKMTVELNAILKFIEKLNDVETENVLPMTSVIPTIMSMKEDKVIDGGYAKDIMATAPLSEDDYFMVPKVVE